jgi:hypothetical protein
VLVNAIDGQCYEVRPGAVSIENMISGGSDNRSLIGEQILSFQRGQGALCCIVGMPLLYGEQSYAYKHSCTNRP